MTASDEGQRKLAAILSADVAGYTRLMADDERAKVRALAESRAVFRKHIFERRGTLPCLARIHPPRIFCYRPS